VHIDRHAVGGTSTHIDHLSVGTSTLPRTGFYLPTTLCVSVASNLSGEKENSTRRSNLLHAFIFPFHVETLYHHLPFKLPYNSYFIQLYMPQGEHAPPVHIDRHSVGRYIHTHSSSFCQHFETSWTASDFQLHLAITPQVYWG